ncbi:hypothetical protein [Pediococcus ethanolidurans]|uniref:hypothetical protein n=1 Tax=Pediococcus ethanolidurans TaxID=319653 RepID=UPI001C1E969F|nr:hypothetical protein [Pediococcus ethanolidurans]MBU7563568.1 hypothetical protein [Pediococcus ethanolidurans]MCT4398076.1 hypothetical protein [Pediococcus ethanolidurans]MCV3324621.1 hypothetical protein [Pediococcus ethanolidurans]MCV3328576.1 hypothetical protein [Pediococcus ethanolidurans]MCV3556033.1 hypothetical protein [Pediococcus ethanolidurans]
MTTKKRFYIVMAIFFIIALIILWLFPSYSAIWGIVSILIGHLVLGLLNVIRPLKKVEGRLF